MRTEILDRRPADRSVASETILSHEPRQGALGPAITFERVTGTPPTVGRGQSGAGLPLDGPDPLDRNQSGADRFFDAMICLLVEDGIELIGHSLKPDDVAKRAGKARASYYRTDGFPAGRVGEDRRAELLALAIRRRLELSASSLDEVTEPIGDYLEGLWRELSPEQFISAVAAANADEANDMDFVAVLLAAMLSASSPEVAGSLRRFFDTAGAGYSSAYAQILEFWQYRVRKPFTLEHLTTAMMAMAQGLAIRRLVDPSLDVDTYGELLALPLRALVVAEGEVDNPMHVVVPPSGTTSPAATRSTIIETLIGMFDGELAAMPDLTQLANASGCSEGVIRQHFGGVVGVIRAAWDEWAPEFDEIAVRERTSRLVPDPLGDLYRVALRVVERAIEQPAPTKALLMAEVGRGAEEKVGRNDPLTELFERLLREAVDTGDFTSPTIGYSSDTAHSAWLFARVLRTTLLHVAVSYPMLADPGQHARWVTDYTWSLLIPARQPHRSSS
ncbi:MAG: hypothetical protein RLZ04_531 [Actinomycetota bacterium]